MCSKKSKQDWSENFTILTYDIIDSTNLEAKRIALNPNSSNVVIWADKQTEGRGKSGRTWVSNEGNLFFSILIKDNIELDNAANMVFLSSICLAKVLEKFSAQKLSLKWPNDVLINSKKCAGILIESGISYNAPKNMSNFVDWLVIGIGVNIESYPETNVDFKATSLYNEGIIIKKDTFLDEFLSHFNDFYYKWKEEGFDFIRSSWLVRAHNLGKNIIVKKNNEEIHGIFNGLDEKGRLILITENGNKELVSTGDVFFP